MGGRAENKKKTLLNTKNNNKKPNPHMMLGPGFRPWPHFSQCSVGLTESPPISPGNSNPFCRGVWTFSGTVQCNKQIDEQQFMFHLSLFVWNMKTSNLFFASSSLFFLTGEGVRLLLNRKELLGTSGTSSAVTVLTGSGLCSGFSLPELKINKIYIFCWSNFHSPKAK